MNHSKLFLISLVLALYLFTQTTYAQTFPSSVINNMASRQTRYHHYMWHQIRQNWNSFSSSTQKAFKNIGWQPPNPSRDSSGQSITNNFAGEDFLYMHRSMINTAKQVATQNKQSTSMISGWTSVPAPGDKSYPVPIAFKKGSDNNYLSEYKDQSRYNTMKNQESRLKDYSRLKKMSLNDLGVEIETGIHNNFHLRWSDSNSVGYRGGDVSDSNIPNINKKFDDVKYNWLADTYSSQVNPIFWKLHGWIDDRVEDWRKANGLSSIKWSGTWTGGPMANLGSVAKKEGDMGMNMDNEDPDALGDVLQQAIEIFQNSGIKEKTMLELAKLDESFQKQNVRKCKRKQAAV